MRQAPIPLNFPPSLSKQCPGRPVRASTRKTRAAISMRVSPGAGLQLAILMVRKFLYSVLYTFNSGFLLKARVQSAKLGRVKSHLGPYVFATYDMYADVHMSTMCVYNFLLTSCIFSARSVEAGECGGCQWHGVPAQPQPDQPRQTPVFSGAGSGGRAGEALHGGGGAHRLHQRGPGRRPRQQHYIL